MTRTRNALRAGACAALLGGILAAAPAQALVAYFEDFEGEGNVAVGQPTYDAFGWVGQENGRSFPDSAQVFGTPLDNAAPAITTQVLGYTPQDNGVSIWTDRVAGLGIDIGDVIGVNFDLKSGSNSSSLQKDWRLSMQVGGTWFVSDDTVSDPVDGVFSSLSFVLSAISGWRSVPANAECVTAPCGIRISDGSAASLPLNGMLTAFGFFLDTNNSGGTQRFDNIALLVEEPGSSVEVVPVPAAGALLVTALAGLGALRRRRARA